MYNYIKYLGYFFGTLYLGLYNSLLYNSIYQLCLNNTLNNIQLVFMTLLIYLFGIRDTFTYLIILTIFNKLQYIKDLIDKFNNNYKLNEYFTKGHNYIQENYNEYMDPYVNFINERLDMFMTDIYAKLNNNEKYLFVKEKVKFVKEVIDPYLDQLEEISMSTEINNDTNNNTNVNMNLDEMMKNINTQLMMNMNDSNGNLENMMNVLQNPEFDKNQMFQDLVKQLNDVNNLASTLETNNQNNNMNDDNPNDDNQNLNRAQKRFLKKLQKKQDKKNK